MSGQPGANAPTELAASADATAGSPLATNRPLRVIELTEFQHCFVDRSELSEDEGLLLWEKYGNQVAVETPSFKTKSKWRLTAQGWVGYIPLGKELGIRLLPKVELGNIFRMLEYAFRLENFWFFDNLVDCQSLEDFYERLANVLARRVLDRARRGYYRAYLGQSDQLPFVRGRLDMGHVMRKPWSAKPFCEFEEHTADIEENQILTWTLWRITQSGNCSERVLPTVRQAFRSLQGLTSLEQDLTAATSVMPPPPVARPISTTALPGFTPITPVTGGPSTVPPPFDDGPEPSSTNRWLLMDAAVLTVVAVIACAFLFFNLRSGGLTDATPTPGLDGTAIAPTAQPGNPIISALTNAPVYAGPDTVYPAVGTMLAGQTAEVISRSADQAWWVIRFPAAANGQGWVAAILVQAENTDNVPVVAPPPTPKPTSTPALPVAVITGPQQALANEELAFSGVKSTTTPGSIIVRYAWDFGNGTTAQDSEVTVIYQTPGTFQITLTVIDDRGLQGQTTQQVTVVTHAQ